MNWQGFPFKEAEHTLAKINAMSSAELKEWRNNKKWKIATYHYKQNPIYRKKIGDQLPQRWEDLPIIKKSDFFLPLDQLLSSEYTVGSVYKSKTSGSSGKPLLYAKDKFCHALTWANILDRYQEHGIEYGKSLQARFYAIPLEGLDFYKEQFKDRLSARRRFIIHDMADAKLAKFVDRFSNTAFEYVYGYTNSLVLFARYLERKNINLKTVCPSIKLCIVTSEMCTEDDKQLLEKAFGIPVLNEYGASELDMLAFSNKSGEWELNKSTLLIEFLDKSNQPVSPGETGRIIVTSLFNKAMPFIRYELGDLGSPGEQPFILSQLQGRLNDVVHLPSGKLVPGFTLYYVTKAIMNDIKGFREYNIKQTRLDTIEIDIVADKALSTIQIEKIKSHTEKYLEPNLFIKVNQVDKIEKGVNGKMKHFQSLI